MTNKNKEIVNNNQAEINQQKNPKEIFLSSYLPECQPRAKKYLNRLENLTINYIKNSESFIEINRESDKSPFITEAGEVGFKYLTSLERFNEETKSIEIHFDKSPGGLDLESKKLRVWLVASKIAQQIDKENKFLSHEKTLAYKFFNLPEYPPDTFNAPWHADAQQILSLELLNNIKEFEENPLEYLLQLWELGAKSIEFKKIDYQGKKEEALAIELLFKLNGKESIEKVSVPLSVIK